MQYHHQKKRNIIQNAFDKQIRRELYALWFQGHVIKIHSNITLDYMPAVEGGYSKFATPYETPGNIHLRSHPQ